MIRAHAELDGRTALAEQLAEFDGSVAAGFNATEEALLRHPSGRCALIWCRGAERRELSYGQVAEASAAMAAHLHARGVQAGTRVAVLLPKRPALLAALYGAWHLGATVVPLFTAFGPDAISTRLTAAAATVLITETPLVERLPALAELDVIDVDALAAPPQPAPPLARHSADSPFILIYTSGTTGPPKGVPVPLFGMVSFRAYLEYAVDLKPDDVLWNMADPGWAYGLYCGIVGPMLMGHTIRFLQEKFDPVRFGAFAQTEGVTNIMSSPTAYRALCPELRGTPIRVGSSAGEPLAEDVVRAFYEATGARLLDQYGQSELGMVAGNHHGLSHEVVPGSMGRPLPGYRLAVLDEQGRRVVGTPGRLALLLDESPMNFFRGYHAAHGGERIDDGWYLTGDLAIEDEAGHFTFASRSDDVILTAGYRVGPEEIETPLRRHADVADCAVVGCPDAERGQRIVAFVVPSRPDLDEASLGASVRAYVKREVAAHLAPREVHIIDEVPRTPSGKAQRYMLRRRLTGR